MSGFDYYSTIGVGEAPTSPQSHRCECPAGGTVSKQRTGRTLVGTTDACGVAVIVDYSKGQCYRQTPAVAQPKVVEV